jgi:hypothetical protein
MQSSPPVAVSGLLPYPGERPDIAVFRRRSLISDKQFDAVCIILFCGMLPLIWSFDHFYFGQVRRFPQLHGRAAWSARPAA